MLHFLSGSRLIGSLAPSFRFKDLYIVIILLATLVHELAYVIKSVLPLGWCFYWARCVCLDFRVVITDR